MVTICEDVEGLSCRVQAGEAGGFGGDGSPALQRRLQGRRPVGDDPQRLAPYWHHLRPLRPRLIGVRLLDCRQGDRYCCQRGTHKHSVCLLPSGREKHHMEAFSKGKEAVITMKTHG